MARYYKENTGEHSYTQTPRKKPSKSEKLLSREYWRGQLHGGSEAGGNGPVHARHMSPGCSPIPLRISNLFLYRADKLNYSLQTGHLMPRHMRNALLRAKISPYS